MNGLSFLISGALDRCLSACVDGVLPQRCVVCGLSVSSSTLRPAPVCASCVAGLKPISGERCRVCGVGLVSEHETCLRCRGRELFYDRHVSVFAYAGVAKQLIIAYKFGARVSLADVFAPFLTEVLLRRFVPPPAGEDTVSTVPEVVLVPVPPSRSGARKRGWDQVAGLSRRVRRLARIEAAAVLQRRGGREQKRLDVQGRSANLLGTVRLRNGGEQLQGRNVVLLDDVYTTGATINECARVLRTAHAARVDAVTLAAD